jgi:protein-S-isoprenylcysteine O-methyltransferase Ste14
MARRGSTTKTMTSELIGAFVLFFINILGFVLISYVAGIQETIDVNSSWRTSPESIYITGIIILGLIDVVGIIVIVKDVFSFSK